MTNEEIKQVLIDKGVSHLYHANTVGTAATFLQNGGLISRGDVEDRGLYQTRQVTDESDKGFEIYYDIFFDSVDIHERANNLNNYGPVTFVYSLDLIDKLPRNSIKITKTNPIYWSRSMSEEEKYFTELDELERNYKKGDFGQHLTIVDQHYPLPFTHLKKIILDNPHFTASKNIDLFNNAKKYIPELMKYNGVAAAFTIRKCATSCNCRSKYNHLKDEIIWYKFGY